MPCSSKRRTEKSTLSCSSASSEFHHCSNSSVNSTSQAMNTIFLQSNIFRQGYFSFRGSQRNGCDRIPGFKGESWGTRPAKKRPLLVKNGAFWAQNGFFLAKKQAKSGI